MWPGAHFKFHSDINGERVSRMYTPVSPVNQKGSATFVLKIYRPCEEFPNGGKFTSNLEKNYKVGDSLLCEGPYGLAKYFGSGNFRYKGKPLTPKKRIGLIAGGTGITPMYAIAYASLHANEGIDFTFLYSNKTKNDVFLQKELDELATKFPNQFKLFYTLTRHNEERDGKWEGLTGRMS